MAQRGQITHEFCGGPENAIVYELTFGWWVEYKATKIDDRCDCKCCEFRQNVKLDVNCNMPLEISGYIFDRPVQGANEKPVEDCATAEGDSTAFIRALGKTPTEAEKCFGRGEGPVSTSEYVFGAKKTPCEYVDYDTPSATLSKKQPSGAKYSAVFIGRIYDRCGGWRIKATKMFAWEITASGQSVGGATAMSPTEALTGMPLLGADDKPMVVKNTETPGHEDETVKVKLYDPKSIKSE